eukprot:351585-Chlamydomonas_euryale.AAC.13
MGGVHVRSLQSPSNKLLLISALFDRSVDSAPRMEKLALLRAILVVLPACCVLGGLYESHLHAAASDCCCRCARCYHHLLLLPPLVTAWVDWRPVSAQHDPAACGELMLDLPKAPAQP